MTILTAATFNYEHGGWNEAARRHDLDPLISTIAVYPPPDVLFLTECTYWADHGQKVLWEAVHRLSALLPHGAHYRAFLGQRHTSRNPPALLVSTPTITPRRWYPPATTTSQRLWNFLQVEAGPEAVPLWLSPIHFDGTQGRSGFDAQASALAVMGAKPALVGGDFNATSSWPGEIPIDWHQACAHQPWKLVEKGRRDEHGRWTLDTRPIDLLRDSGWWDLGETANDPTPTTNKGGSGLRIDRLLATHTAPLTLVPGSYHVHIPPQDTPPPSDHRYVWAQMRLESG